MTDKPTRTPRDPSKPRKSPDHSARKVDDIDRLIGARIAQRRMALSMTQTSLGKVLGLTYQQIQKYEAGTNRIAGSTLFKLAKALGVEPGYFYRGAGEITPILVPDNLERLLNEGGRALAEDYLALPLAQRKMISSLARSLASEHGNEDVKS